MELHHKTKGYEPFVLLLHHTAIFPLKRFELLSPGSKPGMLSLYTTGVVPSWRFELQFQGSEPCVFDLYTTRVIPLGGFEPHVFWLKTRHACPDYTIRALLMREERIELPSPSSKLGVIPLDHSLSTLGGNRTHDPRATTKEFATSLLEYNAMNRIRTCEPFGILVSNQAHLTTLPSQLYC